MKAVISLTVHEKETLKEAIANHSKNRVRIRAHAIILSDKGYSILALTDIFDAKFETISSWIDHWEACGIVGLYDAVRIGRKPIYTALIKDKEEMLTFYDFPAEHWVHIRTSNPIESTFATVRLRTHKVKSYGSRTTTLMMAFKLTQSAEKSWYRLKGFKLLADVITGVKFKDGIIITQDKTEEVKELIHQI